MYRHLLATLVLGLLLGSAAAAQPTAEQVVDRAMQAYASMMDDVETYVITMDVMGHQQQMFFERRDDGTAFDYRAYMITPEGLVSLEEDLPLSAAAAPPADMFARMKASARFVGEETIDGERVYVIALDDASDLFDSSGLPADGEFEIRSATYHFSADHRMIVGFDAEGTVRHNGGSADVDMQMRSTDFRTVGPMHHPFATSMRIEGLTDGLSEEDRRQLEDVKRQLEQLPAEQRAMMEQAMGDQLKQLERMAAGDAMEMEMRVIDLQVNVPRPE